MVRIDFQCNSYCGLELVNPLAKQSGHGQPCVCICISGMQFDFLPEHLPGFFIFSKFEIDAP